MGVWSVCRPAGTSVPPTIGDETQDSPTTSHFGCHHYGGPSRVFGEQCAACRFSASARQSISVSYVHDARPAPQGDAAQLRKVSRCRWLRRRSARNQRRRTW